MHNMHACICMRAEYAFRVIERSVAGKPSCLPSSSRSTVAGDCYGRRAVASTAHVKQVWLRCELGSLERLDCIYVCRGYSATDLYIYIYVGVCGYICMHIYLLSWK